MRTQDDCNPTLPNGDLDITFREASFWWPVNPDQWKQAWNCSERVLNLEFQPDETRDGWLDFRLPNELGYDKCRFYFIYGGSSDINADSSGYCHIWLEKPEEVREIKMLSSTSISGRAYCEDSPNQPISGVTISAIDYRFETLLGSTYTKDDGTYLLGSRKPRSGQYSIRAGLNPQFGNENPYFGYSRTRYPHPFQCMSAHEDCPFSKIERSVPYADGFDFIVPRPNTPLILGHSTQNYCSDPSRPISVQWRRVDNATHYNLRFNDQANPWDESCNSRGDFPGDFCRDNILAETACSGETCSYTMSGLSNGTNYEFWADAANSCGGSVSSTHYFFRIPDCNVPRTTVIGTVYNDANCSLNPFAPGVSGFDPSSVSKVQIDGYGYPFITEVDEDGKYSFFDVPLTRVGENRTISLTDYTMRPDGTQTYFRACPGSPDIVSSPITGPVTQDFFLTNQYEPWWQTIGGDLKALGTIDSPIPPFCLLDNSGLCKAYLSLSLPNLDSGIVSSSNLTIPAYARAREGTNYYAQTGANPGLRQNFEYFKRLLQIGPNGESATPWPTVPPNPTTDAKKPRTVGNQHNIYYVDGDLTINRSSWTIQGTHKLTVFVTGDLIIKNTITVNTNGFVAFIVKGDIYFDQSLGSNDPVTVNPSVTGIFIADGTLNTRLNPRLVSDLTPDKKFVGNGVFVGWSGINLWRNFKSTNNNTNPVELFNYSPNLIQNAPNQFKRSRYTWQEVAP